MKYIELKGYDYKLAAPEIVQVGIFDTISHEYLLLCDGMLTLKKDYAWDGSSIPLKKLYKWLRDVDKYCKIASLVHDGLCQLMREELLPRTHKQYADDLYRRMCIEYGMKKWEADLRYWALRKFGDPFIQKEENPRDRVLEFP